MEEYQTTDIILAACLCLHGIEMTRIVVNGTKGTFCFEDVSDDFIAQYDLGKILVEPVAFNNKIKQLTTSVRRMTQRDK